MAAVAVQLRPLVLMDGVLDGQRVQAELGAEHVQVLTVGLTQAQPHHRGIIPEKVADLGDRKPFQLQHAARVQPGARLALAGVDSLIAEAPAVSGSGPRNVAWPPPCWPAVGFQVGHGISSGVSNRAAPKADQSLTVPGRSFWPASSSSSATARSSPATGP